MQERSRKNEREASIRGAARKESGDGIDPTLVRRGLLPGVQDELAERLQGKARSDRARINRVSATRIPRQDEQSGKGACSVYGQARDHLRIG